jgi:hypothetical protein
VFCSELAIRCQSGVVCSKSLPNWLPAVKQFLLLNWLPAANQFSLPNWAACSELVLAADFYNKPPRQK